MWFWQPVISLTPAGWFLAAAMPLNIPATLGQGNRASPHAPSPSTLSVAQRLPPPHPSGLQIWPASTRQDSQETNLGPGPHGWSIWGDTVGWARSRQHGNTLALLVAAAGRGPRPVLHAPAPGVGGSSASSHFVRALNFIPKLRTGEAAEEAEKQKQMREQKGSKI